MGFLEDVRREAKNRGLTFTEIAKRAGYKDATSLSRKSIKDVSWKTIEKVSKVLNLNANQYREEKEIASRKRKAAKKQDDLSREPKTERWTSLDSIIENVKSAVIDCEKAKKKLQRADAQLSTALGELARDFQRLAELRKGVRFLHGSTNKEGETYESLR